MTVLQFAPLSSSLTPAFWASLTKLKIDVLKLSDESVPVRASWNPARSVLNRESGQLVGLGCHLNLDEHSFSPAFSKDAVPMQGTLKNFNTIEAFKSSDKAALFDAVVSDIRTSLQQETTAAQLNQFLLLTFADLKKYKFYYWFAFPAFVAKPAFEFDEWRSLSEAFSQEGENEIQLAYQLFMKQAGHEEAAACLLKYVGTKVECAPLSQYDTFFAGVDESDRILVFNDASSTANVPAWPLRNILLYLSIHNKCTSIRLITLRSSHSQTAVLSLPPQDVSTLQATGWEKSANGKLGARLADLAPMLDPTRLADQAVDLNLKLMKWRILPELDLDRVKNTKCLLLGAGTLGCYVARTLLAWGVRKITLIDSATVSYSNPVRQPLFEFADCLESGKPKAECAAQALRRIYPSVDAKGIKMNIPMPGHPIPQSSMKSAVEEIEKLDQLIQEHDVVYLLMDSRESRWLPTVLGAVHHKLVMNAALGFDSYLVMRHGVPSDTQEKQETKPGERYIGQLGCYFCNDIVAPTDSLSDRTLDQMCTVTRPGLAAIASATAVELMVSVLQHPEGIYAPSDVALPNAKEEEEPLSVLGQVPHQIRGFLARFTNLKITGQAYVQCTGCSPRVLEEYRARGKDMVVDACGDAEYLERLTGLDKMKEESERVLESLEWSDGNSEEM